MAMSARGRAQAPLGPDAAGRAGRRVFDHRRHDRHAGDAERRRVASSASWATRPSRCGNSPRCYFGRPEGLEKIRRRKNITLPGSPAIAGQASRWRAPLAWRPTSGPAQIETRYKRDLAQCAALRRHPRQFPRPQLDRAGRTRHRRRRRGRRARRVRARQQPGQDHLPRSARRSASGSRSTASITPSSACSQPKAARWAASRTISRSCPSPPASTVMATSGAA